MFYLFACNQSAFEVFERVTSQWRVAFGGFVGLDYNVVFSLFDMLSIAADQRLAVLDDVRVMEKEALSILNESNQ